jgi:hypothetical protein
MQYITQKMDSVVMQQLADEPDLARKYALISGRYLAIIDTMLDVCHGTEAHAALEQVINNVIDGKI